MPLHFACLSGNVEIVKYLLEKGAQLNVPDYSNEIKYLHLACKSGNIELIEYLLNSGLDINQQIFLGYTPLFYAVENNKKDAVEYLIKKNADINAKVKFWYYKTINRTVLHIACDKGYYDIVKLLLDNNINLITEEEEANPLHYACQAGNVEIVKLLLERGFDINQKTNSSSNHLRIIYILLLFLAIWNWLNS